MQYLYILWLESLFTVLKYNFVPLTEHINTKVLDHVRLKVVPIARCLGAHLLELLFFLGLFLLLLILLDGARVDTIRDQLSLIVLLASIKRHASDKFVHFKGEEVCLTTLIAKAFRRVE